MKLNSKSQFNLCESNKTEIPTLVATDLMIPLPENSSLQRETEVCERELSKNQVTCDEFTSTVNTFCEGSTETQYLGNIDSLYEDINSPENFDDFENEAPLNSNLEHSINDAKENGVQEDCCRENNFINKDTKEEEVVLNNNISDVEHETSISENALLPAYVNLAQRDAQFVKEATPEIPSSPSDEKDPVSDSDLHEDQVQEERVDTGYDSSINEDISFDHVESNVDYAVKNHENNEVSAAEEVTFERQIISEVEDITSDCRDDGTPLINAETFSGKSDVNPNLCADTEMTYTKQSTSFGAIDGRIFLPPQSTVISTHHVDASLLRSNSSVLKCNERLTDTEVIHRETPSVLRYCDEFGNEDVNFVLPKIIYNNNHTSSVPEASESENYFCDSSIQNMHDIVTPTVLPESSHQNNLENYSLHQNPLQSPSCIIESYVHSNGLQCSDSNYEFSTEVKPTVKNLPEEENFMKPVKKSFESKIESKFNDGIDPSFKQNIMKIDLSLPLKKRLRTLACAPQKTVTPKEDSFPSYPANPMISIAELVFTNDWKSLPENFTKAGKFYKNNHK